MKTEQSEQKTIKLAGVNNSVKKKLIKAFEYGATISTACEMVGIGRTTFYNYIDSDQQFKEAVQTAKEKPASIAHKVVIDAISNGDLKASMWYLERFNPDFQAENAIRIVPVYSQIKSEQKTIELPRELIEATRKKRIINNKS